MQEKPLHVLGVIGSLNKNSVTRVVVTHVTEGLRARGCSVDLFDPMAQPLDLFDPETAYGSAAYEALQKRVEVADVYILGTPDYHGSMSGTLKNFLDHFWEEFAGKLFASIVASHEKGLTVTDQVRTVARQCYAWSLPYGVSFTDREDVRDNQVFSETLKKRLGMMVHDVHCYGRLLAEQRARDLEGNEPGFMARYRRNKTGG